MRLCYLCSAKRDPKTTLHGFPKDRILRASWIKFCGLTETDDTSRIRLCSSHFQPTDFVDPRAKELGYRLQLKPNTIPTIVKPKKKFKKSHDIKPDHGAGIPTSQFIIQQEPVFLENGEPASLAIEEGEQMPKRRRFAVPRYIGEMESTDFDTPQKAKTALFVAYSKINEQKIKIRRLAQQKRRLVKKIEILNDLVNRLKKPELVTEKDNLL